MNINKLKIGLDVDDVLAGLYIELCKMYDKTIQPIDIWNSDSWIGEVINSAIFNNNLWKNLPKITDPKDIDFKVDCYISHIPEKYKSIRENWLKKNGFPKAPLYTTGDKLRVIKERNLDYFIDDRVDTIDIINNDKHKCIGIQYVPFYHKPASLSTFHIKDIKQFKNMIKFINFLKNESKSS